MAGSGGKERQRGGAQVLEHRASAPARRGPPLSLGAHPTPAHPALSATGRAGRLATSNIHFIPEQPARGCRAETWDVARGTRGSGGRGTSLRA